MISTSRSQISQHEYNSYHTLIGSPYNPYVLNHKMTKDWEFHANRLTILNSLSYAEEEILEQQKNKQDIN
jgi:hypothetical protein